MQIENKDLAELVEGVESGKQDYRKTHTGAPLITHGRNVCEQDDMPCPLHSPSGHPLKDAPIDIVPGSSLLLRICEHEIPHPDPDSLSVYTLIAECGLQPEYDGRHLGCPERCCGSDKCEPIERVPLAKSLKAMLRKPDDDEGDNA